jgi:hypothetical protein
MGVPCVIMSQEMHVLILKRDGVVEKSMFSDLLTSLLAQQQIWWS